MNKLLENLKSTPADWAIQLATAAGFVNTYLPDIIKFLNEAPTPPPAIVLLWITYLGKGVMLGSLIACFFTKQSKPTT